MLRGESPSLLLTELGRYTENENSFHIAVYEATYSGVDLRIFSTDEACFMLRHFALDGSQ